MPADMVTQRQQAPLNLAPVGAKTVALDFDGGRLSSDAGMVLLKDTMIRCKAKSSQDTGVPGLRGAKHGCALNAPGA